jgi:hypothetical protein
MYEYVETDDPNVLGGLERVHKKQGAKEVNDQALILLIGLLYPAIFTFINVSRIGLINIVSDPFGEGKKVILYLVYIGVKIFMVVMQRNLDPQGFLPKIVMLIVLSIVTLLTFGYLRIISSYSPLVQMLASVIADLRFFLIMFAITTVIFSLVITILQNEESEYYVHVGPVTGNLIDTFKMSLGDFEVIGRVMDNYEHSLLFWFSWSVIVLIMSIIFLNFIIAEASASYERVTELLSEVMEQDKCSMLAEAERLTPLQFQDEYNYPKYLIKREVSV